MHNQSLTADGHATIVGGRNIGDEYFGSAASIAFADLDVLVVGPAAREFSIDFDRYWNSESAYPAEKLLPRVDSNLILETEVLARESRSTPYRQAVAQRPWSTI